MKWAVSGARERVGAKGLESGPKPRRTRIGSAVRSAVGAAWAGDAASRAGSPPAGHLPQNAAPIPRRNSIGELPSIDARNSATPRRHTRVFVRVRAETLRSFNNHVD